MTKLKITALFAGIAQILIYGDIEERWWVDEQVNDAQDIINKLNAISEPKIEVRIKSNGGNLAEALAMRNLLAERSKTTEIIFYLDGLVASSATVLPMIAGTKTVMASNALFMVHAPATSYATGRGTATDHQQTADILNKYAEAWAQNISEKTGKPVADILPILTDNQDHYFSAQEALAFGFIDEIGESIQVAASALPKNRQLPHAWLQSNNITAIYQPENANMTGQTKPQPTETTVVEPQAVLQPDAKAVEAKRQSDIKDIFALVSPERTAIHAMQERMLVDASISPEKAREQILAKMGENQEPVARHHHVEAGKTDREKFIETATDALLLKAGIAVPNASANNEMRGWRAERIAEQCLVRANLAVSSDRMSMISAAFTQGGSDFPVLLENAMHKVLLSTYATQPDTWSRFCAVGTVSDFRAHNRYRTGSFGNLDTLTELGEFKNKSIPDGEKSSIKIGTKGNIINISRQAIINDDLSAFIGLARDLARAAKRTIESDVYALLASNPIMADGIPLFNFEHGNFGGGGGVTMAAVETLRQLMASQKDVSGNDYLDLRPSLWVGSMSEGGNARVVNTSVYDPDTANKLQRPNLVNGLFRDVIDTPRITGANWYMFADPMEAPVLEVAFLDGKTEPYIEMQNGWDVDGAAYKVRHDYGVSALDYRGAVYVGD